MFRPSIVWLMKSISSSFTMIQMSIVLRITNVVFTRFVKILGAGPRRNIDKGICMTDPPTKPDVLLMFSMQHNTKVSILQASCTCNLSLLACHLANGTLPFWNEDKGCMPSEFLSLPQVCCPHTFFLIKTDYSRIDIFSQMDFGWLPSSA